MPAILLPRIPRPTACAAAGVLSYRVEGIDQNGGTNTSLSGPGTNLQGNTQVQYRFIPGQPGPAGFHAPGRTYRFRAVALAPGGVESQPSELSARVTTPFPPPPP